MLLILLIIACFIILIPGTIFAKYHSLNPYVIKFILLSIIGFISLKYTEKVKSSDVIVVGISADFPPFTYIENSNTVGFDIDLIEEIGKRLNKKIEIKNMPFGTLIPSLQLGTIQVIAGGLTATPERAKHVLLTKPYLDGTPFVIVSRKSESIGDISQLNNKEVIVNEGYSADLYLSKIIEQQSISPELKRLKTPAEAFLALKSGRAAAFVTAENTVKPFFDKYGASEFNIAVIPDTNENASLAITPKQPNLLTEIQLILDLIKQEGFIDKLKIKWGL